MTSLSRGGGMLVRLATAGAICLSIVGLSLAAGAAVGTAAPLPSGAERAKGDDSTNNDQKAKGSFWDRFRVAQVDQGKASDSSSVDKDKKDTKQAKKEALEEYRVNIPEILIVGSRSLDTDIKRNRDDAQPYVIFDRS